MRIPLSGSASAVLKRQAQSTCFGTPVIARLRPGVTLAQAQAALDPVTLPSVLKGPAPVQVRVVIESMDDDETDGFGATIQHARDGGFSHSPDRVCQCRGPHARARLATRDVELAIRAAVGAGRGRLFRQLLTESLLLALAGAFAGVLLAYLSLDSLVALIPLSLPANSPVEINTTALAFALGLTVITARSRVCCPRSSCHGRRA